MILDLPDTTTSAVSKTLVTIREEGGVVALGRVLTLIIATTAGDEEEAIEAANDASREHPMRVIVVAKDPIAGASRVDAQIRVGGDAGASEVIILRARGEAGDDEEALVTGLLLPDAPVVAWWPTAAPEVAAASSLGRIAQRRITDAAGQADPCAFLDHLASTHRPGDTDFSWTRITLWRGQLAAVLDQPPFEAVRSARVSGASDSPSTRLLAAWLALELAVPVEYDTREPAGTGVHSVTLRREHGDVMLDRPASGPAILAEPGQPLQHLSLPRRSLRDCLAEELRSLAPDRLFAEVLTDGLPLVR